MNPVSLLLLGILGAPPAAGTEQLIDSFRYADTEAARQVWTAGESTPPVETAQDDQRAVVRVTAPFAARPKLLRTVIDRKVKLDLAAPGEFIIEVACDRPEALAHLTLYFRSGEGWYGANRLPARKGWQTLHFSKAAFRPEGSPSGWHEIDGIRIAAWRGRAQDTSIRIRRLAALWHDVALVIPSKAARQDDHELDTALDTADRVGGLLAELGLGSDAVDETAVARGALGKRRVAILAYNPRLDAETAAALERFVAGGGKLLVCYLLPRRLGQVLGFDDPKYVRQERPGDFAQIRFDAADLPELPESVRQASWNITAAEPAGHNARVIGRWYDDAGQPTGHAAMLLSDRGAFFSHIVLAGDRDGTKQWLAAVLGRLCPPLWKAIAQAALDRAGQVGHCHSHDELRQHLFGHTPVPRQPLDPAQKAFRLAEALLAREQYAEAMRQAAKAHDLFVDVYLKHQASPRREGRAVWNHSGTGAYPGDWERSAKVLAAAGFNMVLPNMLWAGRAHYASDVLPRSSTFEQYGDQIAQCCAAAHKHGLEVHVWKVNYNLSGAPRDFVDRLSRAGRLQVTIGGEPREWLCPSHPENQRLELESMLEVARKYPVDGLHFDYIRYPGSDSCYCDGCLARFEADTGRKVAEWPGQCHSGSLREAYNDWRCRQITSLVAAVHRQGKELRGELKISAAVFGSYPACRRSIAQDWPLWVKAGYLDFVCPMDYTESDVYFAGLVKNQLELVGGRIPVYAGIGATATRVSLSADRVVGQIHHARSLGAAGFTVFNFHRRTAESIVPGVGLGAGTQVAVPPHRDDR